MSNGYRNGAFAFGVVVGLGLALNLFLWIDYSAQTNSDQYTQANNPNEYSQVGGLWDRLIGTFVSPSDTLAQWIMAIFTVVAVIVIWKTLSATREMVVDTKQMAEDAADTLKVTERIGIAQVRAYLSIVIDAVGVRPPVDGSPGQRDGCNIVAELNVHVRNTGQSPAFYPRYIYGFAVLPHSASGNPADVFETFSSEKPAGFDIPSNGSSGTAELKRVFTCDLGAFKRGDHVLFVYLQVEYRDVFQKTLITPPTIGTITFEELQSEKPKIYWRGVDVSYQGE